MTVLGKIFYEILFLSDAEAMARKFMNFSLFEAKKYAEKRGS